jgi:hypothetical protein
VPRLAHRRVILFFWQTRASSANQTSIASGAYHSRYRRKLYFPAGLEDLSFREAQTQGFQTISQQLNSPQNWAEPGKAYEQAEPGNA